MTSIFYQTEGQRNIAHLEMEAAAKLKAVQEALAKITGLGVEAVIFLEDADNPLDHGITIGEIADAHGVRLHVHRCRSVEVSVTFNGRTVKRKFSPAATIGKVKKWAAIHEFHMSPDDAGEHVLQVAGTHDRPSPGTHIGTLVKHSACHLALTLVPDERVNGNTGAR